MTVICRGRAREVNSRVGPGKLIRRARARDFERTGGPGTLTFFEAPGIFLNVRGYENYSICLAFAFFKK